MRVLRGWPVLTVLPSSNTLDVMEFMSLVRMTPQEAAKRMGMEARSEILRRAGTERKHSGGAYGTSHG